MSYLVDDVEFMYLPEIERLAGRMTGAELRRPADLFSGRADDFRSMAANRESEVGDEAAGPADPRG